MQKILLGLGTLGIMATPMIAVVSCSGSNISSNKDAQKDVDKVFYLFKKANLVINPQNAVKAAKGNFNSKVLQNLGGYNGVYPGILPDGINMTYKVNNIPVGKSDNLVVTISKKGAKDKKFNILVDVSKVKLVDVNTEALAKANINYDVLSKTLTIGNKVGEINFNISSITDDKGNKWKDAKNIAWGNHPQNILKIGNAAFCYSELNTLDLSGLTNLTTIGAKAFYNSQLSTLDLSELTNLTTIGETAFVGSELSTLDLSGLTNLTTIGNGAFYNSKLSTLDLSGLTNLTTIGVGAFYNSQLSTLDLSGLPNLNTIGEAAFVGSELSTLDLSGLTNLTTIGEEAFLSSQLNTLDLSGLTNLTTIGNGAFWRSPLNILDLSGLTNLTKIGDEAFGSVLTNLQLNMDEVKYKQLIHDDQQGGIDNRIEIFGANGNTVHRIDPK